MTERDDTRDLSPARAFDRFLIILALLGVAVAVLAALTRGLHLDGLADTADGLGPVRDRDRALQVMHRGDVGPFGVVALVLTLLLQVSCAAVLLADVLEWPVADIAELLDSTPAAINSALQRARAALDGKNAALREQIGSLEGKVKSLQATLGAPPAPAVHTPPAPAVQAPPGPKPISAIKALVPRKPKTAAPEPEAALPWGWIGGGAALLLVEVVDEHERRGGPRCGAGDQAHPQVEGELRHGAEPEADADADDERGEDEHVPVQSGKRT